LRRDEGERRRLRQRAAGQDRRAEAAVRRHVPQLPLNARAMDDRKPSHHMSIITNASALLADIAVETDRTDAVQSFVKQETILVPLTTADGLEGTGYAYTIGTGGTSVLALLRDHLLPLLAGKDARDVEALWQGLFGLTRATTTGALTSLALAAIDTA